MKVKLLKNIKYNGKPYKSDETIEVSTEDINVFVEKEIISGDYIVDVATIDDDEEADTSKVGDINNLTKDNIIETLTQMGIEHNPKDKKEILYNLMIEGD